MRIGIRNTKVARSKSTILKWLDCKTLLKVFLPEFSEGTGTSLVTEFLSTFGVIK